MNFEPESVSGPEHPVTIRKNRWVEVRDGTRLATDVYLPDDPADSGDPPDPKPALLVRTPYDKGARDRVEDSGLWYAARGYVVAIQDVRGRYASEGTFRLLENEPEDGYDTVQWLADQPYCDGQVGTMGTSYMAWVQVGLATLAPPALSAMFVNQGGANAWESSLRHHGAFELKWLSWALTKGAVSKASLEDPEIQRVMADVDVRDVYQNGPVVRGQSPLRHIPTYEEWLFDLMTSDGSDERWHSRGLCPLDYVDESADVPTVFASGWYDSYSKAISEHFRASKAAKDSDQFLVFGPWTHGGLSSWGSRSAGEVEFGPSASIDYLEVRLSFFDQYLKGHDTWHRDPVTYYQMGGGRRPGPSRMRDGTLSRTGEWQSATDWPLPSTRFVDYFAHPNGELSPDQPTAENASTSFVYDPADPVPTVGGNCSSYVTVEPRPESIEEMAVEERPTRSITGQGGYDQRTRPDTFGADPPYGPLEARNDVVVFRTPRLTDPVEIAGPISVSVFGSTDARDTDFTAKLIHEYPPSDRNPGGFALNLSDSICRARYRGYRRVPDPIEPERVYEFNIDLYPTADTFHVGHRIRLDISSSNFPRYDVNHNTGSSPGGRTRTVARNTIHHEREHPTHVSLPVQAVRGPR